jgi:hypothetical protein
LLDDLELGCPVVVSRSQTGIGGRFKIPADAPEWVFDGWNVHWMRVYLDDTIAPVAGERDARPMHPRPGESPKPHT